MVKMSLKNNKKWKTCRFVKSKFHRLLVAEKETKITVNNVSPTLVNAKSKYK